METRIQRCDDFAVDGAGGAAAWGAADWLELEPRWGPEPNYRSRAKILYSATGIYLLFDCEDRRLSCSGLGDFDDLWTEDVVECFLWPDEDQRLYFEYEISPLDVELPILVSNSGGTFMGWRPWHYEGERRCRHATSIVDGPRAPGAAVAAWRAECFLPFALFKGLPNTPPRAGTRWRGNFYRIDHDGGEPCHWSWSPVAGDFHDLDGFGALIFA